jgi:hypothetical protein
LDAVAHGEREGDCDEEPPTDRHRVRQVEDAPMTLPSLEAMARAGLKK